MKEEKIGYIQLLKLIIIGIVVYNVLQRIDIVLDLIDMMLGFLAPFILGFAMAFVLNVIMIRFEKGIFMITKKRAKYIRPLSIMLSIVSVIVVLFFVGFLVIPEVSKTIAVSMKEVPLFFEQMQHWVLDNKDIFPQLSDWISDLRIDWDSLSKSVFQVAKVGFTGVLDSTVSAISSLVTGIFNFIVAFVFAGYILMNKETLKKQTQMLLQAYIQNDRVGKILYIGRKSREIFSNFVVGQCLEAIILGALCALGMAILQLPYALMIGSLVGVTALVPILGAFIGGGVGVFMIMMHDPMQAVIFLVFLLVLQQLEGDFIYPRVVGSSVGLPAIWVLLAVTIGGAIFGILGMLLSVPILSILYVLLKEDTYKRLKKKEITIL